MEFVTRFFQKTNQSFFLFGPRGTGKSTWLKAQFPEATYLDLLAPEIYRQYYARPERLRELCEAQEQNTIIIDEIQKIPQLLDVVHQLMESPRHQRFILTGSSARKLKRSGVDLLAGRAIVKTLHPFMAAELGEAFSLEKALSLGLLPLVINAPEPQETLNSYITLYLREEVQMEGLVRNFAGFSRFLESISFSHGSPLNISEVARECEVERKTVEGFVAILEDLLLAFRIPVFSKRAKRNLVVHQKFYYFDAGVFQSIRPAGPLDSPHEIHGASLEGLVVQHLRAWNAYRQENCHLYYWRTKSGNEVDFVVYGPNTFVAIEVKNTTKLHSKAFTGLKAFVKDYPEAQACLLYRGKDQLKINDILCLPCEDFLRKLQPINTLEDCLRL